MARNGCKVEDVVAEYGLDSPSDGAGSIHDYLVDRWRGNGDHRAVGYRRLTDWFNRQLFRRVYDRHGRSTMGTRLDSEYEALTDEDDLVRAEVVADLAADGIDAEVLLEDMVSPRTMHRHLTDCLEAEKPPRDAETDWERESVDIAREQLVEKVEKSMSALESKGEIEVAGTAEVEVRVYLACPECETRVPLETARRRGYVCADHPAPTPRIPVPDEASVPQLSDSVVESVARFCL